MNNQALVQQYLPQNLWNLAIEYSIDEKSIQEHSDLIILILGSKSLSDKTEKQSWFNMLSIMNEEQITKLHEILTREKEKLEEINQKYAQKQEEINQKYQQTIDTKAYQQAQMQAQAQLQAKENSHRQQEMEEAENLLAQI